MSYRQTKKAPVLWSLHRLEIGHDIPEKLSWRAEVTALSNLRSSKARLHPTAFNGISADPSKRHAHVVQLSPSPDGALLAVAGSDGHLEVHEPDGEDTLRLTLAPFQQRAKVSACAWSSRRGGDTVLLSFYNRPDVWAYDLETCRIDRPCRLHSFSNGSASTTLRERSSDLLRVDDNCYAVAIAKGEIILFDNRVKSGKLARVASIYSGMQDAVLAGEDMLLYAADAGVISVFDRRATPDTPGNSVRGMGAMGNRSSGMKAELVKKSIGRPRGFNFLNVLPGSPPGYVAYQSMDGAVGYTDMAISGATGVHIPEAEALPVRTELGLMAYGETERSLDYPWHIARRRGDIMCSPSGRGWRVATPIVSRPGLRVVSLGPGVEARTFEVPVNGHISCVHAVSNTLEKLVLGGSKNTLGMMSVRLGRSAKQNSTEATVQ